MVVKSFTVCSNPWWFEREEGKLRCVLKLIQCRSNFLLPHRDCNGQIMSLVVAKGKLLSRVAHSRPRVCKREVWLFDPG